MDAEAVRVVAAFEGRSVSELSGAIDRFVGLCERLELPIKILLISVALGSVLAGAASLVSRSSTSGTTDGKKG